MTVNRWCERFRFCFTMGSVLALSFALACRSVPAASATEGAPPLATASPGPIPSRPPGLGDLQAEMSSATVMDGTIVLVNVKLSSALAGKVVSGEFEGIELPFFKSGDGYAAVLGIPLDHKPGPTAVKVRVGSGAEAKTADAPFSVVPGNYPTTTETLKVDARLVQPKNPKDLARIQREVAEIGEVYATVTPKKYWTGPFAFPVKNATYTSSFGKRRIYNGVQTSPHTGLDIKAAAGTPILAASPGKVVLAKNLFFTGNTVILDHGYGVLTLYAHMSKLKVKKGQEVTTGNLLGLAGMTGRANGPHLHWMAIIQKQKVNPLGLTQVMK